MNRLLSLLFSVSLAAASFAQLAGDGYYRVKNAKTQRYIYVIDDKGHINVSTSDYDLYAIILWKNFDKAASDPASVIRIKPVGNQYDLMCQGTGIHQIVDNYASIRKNNNGTYLAYATVSGMTKYLGDAEQGFSQNGVLTTNPTNEYRNWNIIPVTLDDEQYFGVKGELEYDGTHYATLYADFGFDASALPTHLKAYKVVKVVHDMAIIKPVEGLVAPGTALLFTSTSAAPSDNRLPLGLNSAAASSGNLLRGVYFQNPRKSHYNQKAYDPATMRVLGTFEDGSVGFVTSDIDFLPANKAYLPVTEGTASDLRLVTEEEYTLGIQDLTDGQTPAVSAHKGVYTLSGRQVSSDATVVDQLPRGLYIVDGVKVMVP